jgi:hypothetical protein
MSPEIHGNQQDILRTQYVLSRAISRLILLILPIALHI